MRVAQDLHKDRADKQAAAAAKSEQATLENHSDKIRRLVNLLTGQAEDTVLLLQRLDYRGAEAEADGYRFLVDSGANQDLYLVVTCEACGRTVNRLIAGRATSNSLEDRANFLLRFGGLLANAVSDPDTARYHDCGRELGDLNYDPGIERVLPARRQPTTEEKLVVALRQFIHESTSRR